MSQTPDRHLPLKLVFLGLAMFGFGFALVPLYSVFCVLTGFGGRTANAAAVVVEKPDPSRVVRVEFLGSVVRGSDWDFQPDVSHMDLHPGQLYETHFLARNLLDRAVVGQAVPSIAPGEAARYFHKTECFCFTSQHFEPHEERELKVAFLVAPELPADVDTLTLSYTYFSAPDNKD
ncbi:MAG TPA: cytochrome c oxidase assembly protein [Gammaproteobacteria bacterium]|jgi:cytochrome c oxidase assembly protein subunit 11|nr:cytochrome c oxidase assembly protein [Gammaproteobacteria bacterium]